MENVKAVIFDMDGTLLDTLTDLNVSLNVALESCGYPPRSLDETREFIGDGIFNLVARAMPDYLKNSLKDDEAAFLQKVGTTVEAFKNYYIVHGEDNTAPYPHITELLRALKREGRKIAVVSNKVKIAVDELNRRMFFGLIDASAGDGEGLNLKPYPDMLLKVIGNLGVSRDEAVFVGDGDTDIECAKRAGVRCISVCYGYRSEEFLRQKGGRVFAHDAKELAALLGVVL